MALVLLFLGCKCWILILYCSQLLKQTNEEAQEFSDERVRGIMDVYEQRLERIQRKVDEDDEWVSSLLYYQEQMKVEVRTPTSLCHVFFMLSLFALKEHWLHTVTLCSQAAIFLSFSLTQRTLAWRIVCLAIVIPICTARLQTASRGSHIYGLWALM